MKRTSFLILSGFLLLISSIACNVGDAPEQNATLQPVDSNHAYDIAPKIIRLDLQVDGILAEHRSASAKLELLKNHFKEHSGIYATLGHSDADAYAKFLVDGNNEFANKNRTTREYFSGRDLIGEVEGIYTDIMRHLDQLLDKPPTIYLVYGFERGTNARTEVDASGKARILLNLNALSKHSQFQTATRHELVHVAKPEFGRTLLEVSMSEGVACWISFMTRPDIQDNKQAAQLPWHECLFWPKDDYMKAVKLKADLLSAFAKAKDKSDAATLQSFLYLYQTPSSVPKAPDRCGYFVGLIAVQAWKAKNPTANFADLLDVSPQKLWEALDIP